MRKTFLSLLMLAFSSLGFAQQNDAYTLKDPRLFADGKTMAETPEQWTARRAEISGLIQKYEIGEIPAVSKKQIKPKMVGDTLFVDVKVGKNTITLKTEIKYPKTGTAPYPLIIGTSRNSLPPQLLEKYPVALLDYHERQVNGYSQFRGDTVRSNYGFVKLYPHLIDNGAYSEWAWGFQRIIDALEILGPKKTKIDVSRIACTGCSYAGKMSLFCGAFDERVKLVIAQEPGGGGAAAWRVSHTMEGVEDLDHTDFHWFKESLRQEFGGDKVNNLPYDHHELCAMVCPRALLVLGNPDYKWLADESAKISMESASTVWKHYGIPEKVATSIVANHPHCMLPESQYEIVGDFITKFLLK
ncbi:MAG: hypothetical protein MJZ66_08030 [Bacteroidales bacterium]|nr:hypothetical protein [Bacteroidales bacterium]